MPELEGYYEVTDPATIDALNEIGTDENGDAFLDEDYPAYPLACMQRRRRIRFRWIGGHWYYPIPPPRYSQA
jgi:hypothetical protein